MPEQDISKLSYIATHVTWQGLYMVGIGIGEKWMGRKLLSNKNNN